MAAQYTASNSATVGADGRATLTIGPGQAHETWDVILVSVFLTGSDDGEVFMYEGDEAAGNFVDASYVGVRNSSQFTPGTLVLVPGRYLTIVWAGATVGATATARVRYGLL